MALSDKNLVSLVAAEHVGPTETGDNIEAKRVAVYHWDPSAGDGGEWRRAGFNLAAGIDFDYIEVTATDSNTDTLEFKTGGSGGTVVRTLTVNYASADVSKISDTFDNLGYS